MGRTRIKKFVFGAAIIVILVIGAWQLTKTFTSAEPLSEAEATSKAEELYKGKVVNVKNKSRAYEVTMELESGTYIVEMDRDTGEIGRVSRIKEKAAKEEEQETPQQPSENTKDSPGKKPAKQEPKPQEETPAQTVTFITKEEAAQIAIKTINGEVDDMEDIETEELGGVTYYLVDVEREEAEDGTVRINAITGEVTGVFYDD
ncbi:PepSY domain-containing protein [Mesobacillus foraminis]|uniref:Peptidase YpeB-like protein n=1 Tax=Mesobacillus foraminis TaxID=279826 RepID=A0A4R2BLE9_9BACI|nr:PepSY domain-containing protein [Mesobacillus foraminis]TCN26854.1 peptidase YpeB-like protein [Mesobacillus foraminis]